MLSPIELHLLHSKDAYLNNGDNNLDVTDCLLNVYSNSSSLQEQLSEVMCESLKHLKGGRSP